MAFRYNSTGVNVDSNFVAAPEGNYWLIIRKASDEKEGMARLTKNGDPYVSVECEIDEGEWLGNKVWNNVTFLPKDRKGAGMAVNFLKTIGEPWEGEFDVDPEDWVGKRFRAHLVLTKDMKNRPKNEISYLVAAEKEEETPF